MEYLAWIFAGAGVALITTSKEEDVAKRTLGAVLSGVGLTRILTGKE